MTLRPGETVGSDDPLDDPSVREAFHRQSPEELNQAVEDAVRPYADEKRAMVENVVRCDQCGVLCLACGIGEPHMNINLPFPGYTHGQTGSVDWSAHNAQGHHHVMWNGAFNETVPCGSKRARELALMKLKNRASNELPDPNARQVGGSHYGGGKLQHWDIVAMFKLDYFQGNITKYIFRWRDKGGIEDLEKAKHYLEKYITEVRASRL